MIFPFYAPLAHAEEGIRKVHLIGIIEALLLFAFAGFWSQLILPKALNQLALALIFISFWSNVVGSALIAITGVNTLTHLFLSGSEYIVIPILIALLGLQSKPYSANASKWVYGSMLLLTVLMSGVIFWQTFSVSSK